MIIKSKKTKNIINYLLLISILILLIPSFVVLPELFNRTTHTIANVAIILLFLFTIFLNSNLKNLLLKSKTLFFLLTLNILTFSLSIIKSLNVIIFLQYYKNFFISWLIFLLVLLYFSKTDVKKIINILITGLIINLVINILIYINGYSIFRFLIHPKNFYFIDYQTSRNRFFTETIEGAFVPIFFYFFIKSKDFNKISFSLFFIFLSTIIAIISGWRIKMLILFFSLLGSFFVFTTSQNLANKKRIKIILVLLFFVFYLTNAVSLFFLRRNTVDRLVDPERIDYMNIKTRFDMWQSAIEMGKSFPWFGVGLGNFYDYLNSADKSKNYFSILTRDQPLIDNPHNIFFAFFAETGIFGLLSFIFLITYFLREDFYCFILKRKDLFVNTIIISFWSNFLFSLTNPFYGFNFLITFWLFRALIIIMSTK